MKTSNKTPKDFNINIASIERILSGAGGAALVVSGLIRALPGLTVAAGGVVMIARATTGHSWLYRKIGISSAQAAKKLAQEPIALEHALRIAAPREDVYAALTDPTTASKVIARLERIEQLEDGTTSRLYFRDTAMRFDCDIAVQKEAPSRIAWHAVPNSEDELSPSFSGVLVLEEAEGGASTDVTVDLEFAAHRPLGKIVAAVMRPFAASLLRVELARLERHLRGEPVDGPADDEETGSDASSTDAQTQQAQVA